jgi:hypothetical protein
LRLFKGCRVSAFLNLVVTDEFGLCPLCPTPRGWIELVRKDAHGNRDGDAFGIEIPEFTPILPIETGARNSVKHFRAVVYAASVFGFFVSSVSSRNAATAVAIDRCPF